MAAIVVVVVVVATVAAGSTGVRLDVPGFGMVPLRRGRVVRAVLDGGAVAGGTVEAGGRGAVVGGAVGGGVVGGLVVELKVGSAVRCGAAEALDARPAATKATRVRKARAARARAAFTAMFAGLLTPPVWSLPRPECRTRAPDDHPGGFLTWSGWPAGAAAG
jgi:hypothetical protein